MSSTQLGFRWTRSGRCASEERREMTYEIQPLQTQYTLCCTRVALVWHVHARAHATHQKDYVNRQKWTECYLFAKSLHKRKSWRRRMFWFTTLQLSKQSSMQNNNESMKWYTLNKVNQHGPGVRGRLTQWAYQTMAFREAKQTLCCF